MDKHKIGDFSRALFARSDDYLDFILIKYFDRVFFDADDAVFLFDLLADLNDSPPVNIPTFFGKVKPAVLVDGFVWRGHIRPNFKDPLFGWDKTYATLDILHFLANFFAGEL